jgi:hypothetical protein
MEPEQPCTDIQIAVVGCAHGELDLIYKCILTEEREKKCKVDLLICCGDFECARNDNDLLYVEGESKIFQPIVSYVFFIAFNFVFIIVNSLPGPVKFRGHKDFYKYYNKERYAPVLTLFIGGNHEAVNFLQELYFGGYGSILCVFVCLFVCVCLLACLFVCLFVFACLLVCLFGRFVYLVFCVWFVCLFVCMFVCLVCLFVCLFVCWFGLFGLFVCWFVGLFVCLFVCLFVGLFVCLFVGLLVCWFVCLFVCLLVWLYYLFSCCQTHV